MPNHILIIDDDEDILEVTQMILEDQGYRVTTGQSGQELFELLDQGHPDLIIMDLWLDGDQLNGNNLAHSLKSNPTTKNIPILLFSALTHAQLETEANGFIRKPYDLETLVQLVAHHLEQAHTESHVLST